MKYQKTIKLYEEVGDSIGEVSYVDHMGSDKTIVNAARVSYGKEIEDLREKDIKLIQFLVDHNHSSPFEHCLVTMKFVVPLYVRSQHMRHRTFAQNTADVNWWSFNEISRRYTEEDVRFYEPNKLRGSSQKDKQSSGNWFDPDMYGYSTQTAQALVQQHHDNCFSLYHALLDAGVCREMARGVLPNSTYTEYYGSCNVSNLMKFLELRSTEHAQWEIRQVAFAVEEILQDLFPETVKCFKNKNKSTRWTF